MNKLLDWLLGARPQKNSFHGGLHLPAHKALSTKTPTETHPLEPYYYLSLRQKDGAWLEPIVKEGEHILKGQTIATPTSNRGLKLHAPTSGHIEAIRPMPDIHPQGESALSIIIKTDYKDERTPKRPSLDENHPREILLERIADCGIAGLGGAGFPTALKLKHPSPILIINAAECEPYISCDDMQIRDKSEDIVRGAQLTAHIIQAAHILFAIEDDKPQAIKALEKAIARAKDSRIKLQIIPTRYPSGNSQQLIEITLKKRIPKNSHSSDHGIICHNSATIKAIYDALQKDQALIERYITLTGENLNRPHNRLVRIGTPLQSLLKAADGCKTNSELRIGGPMMGEIQKDLQAGTTKTTNCLLFLPQKPQGEQQECIRCAHCANACPMSLLPQQLYWFSRQQAEKQLKHYQLFSCIECGICESVCPSNIPLVAYYRDSKQKLKEEKRKKEQAEHAKMRHEAREKRLEREAKARHEKMQAKRAQLAKAQQQETFNPTATTNPSQNTQNAIEAAKKRAEERRQARLKQSAPNTSAIEKPTNEDKQSAIETAKKRAEERRQARLKQSAPNTSAIEKPSNEDKQNAIEAAKKRAEERRQARLKQSAPNTTSAIEKPSNEDKQNAIEAAKKRAEERRQARLKQSAPNTSAIEKPTNEDKQNAIEAAKKRAEERRQARLKQSASNTSKKETTVQENSEIKQGENSMNDKLKALKERAAARKKERLKEEKIFSQNEKKND